MARPARGGGRFGRAVVTRSREGDEHAGPDSLRLPARPALRVPHGAPGGLLHGVAVRTFNAALWHRSPHRERDRPIGAVEQLLPLDRVGDWNRLYGRRGLLQYQFAVPRGQEWAIAASLEMLRARRCPMFLAALKRFGAASGGLLSFPIQGWTLALDIPARARGRADVLDAADRLVVGCRRARLPRQGRPPGRRDAARDVPRAAASGGARARRPEGALRSDLARRLELSE